MSKKNLSSVAALSALLALSFCAGCDDAGSASPADSASASTTLPLSAGPVKEVSRASTPTQPAPQAQAPVAKKEPLVISCSGFDSHRREFDFRFSEDVSEKELEKHVTVEPALPFRIIRYGNRNMSVRADFSPGFVYAVRISGAMAGTQGLPAGEEYVATAIAPDLPSVLNFASAGTFLPLGTTHWELPVNLVNAPDALEITTREAYPDRLVAFVLNRREYDASRQIFQKTVKTDFPRNKKDVFALELEKIGIARRPGIFSVEIRNGERYHGWQRDRNLVVVTDLAVQAVRNADELAVILKTLSGNAFVPNADVEVFSSKGRKITSAKTDAQGFVKVRLPELQDGEDSPALLVAKSGNDTTFLSMEAGELSVVGSGKNRLFNAANAYVFAERGICRPGEKIRVFANLRDGEKLFATGGVPAEFAVSDPSGNALARIPVVGDEFGFYSAEIVIPTFAETGTYRARLCVPGQEKSEFGSCVFRVAEFVPDTFSVALKSSADEEKMTVFGDADYYFGAPLSAGKVRLSRAFSVGKFAPKSASEFAFGLPTSFAYDFYEINALQQQESDTVMKTDADGEFTAVFQQPTFAVPVANPIGIDVTASVSGEHGGRSVSAGTRKLVHYANFYAGTCEAAVADDARTYEFKALSPDEKPVSLSGEKFRAELLLHVWSYVLKERPGGKSSYVWQEREVPSGTIEFDGGDANFTLPIPESGHYTMKISDAAGTLVHLREFWHYSGETGIRSANATNLVFALDREEYLPGETAKITFESGISGKANVVFGSEKIEGVFALDVKVGKNVFELPVSANTVRGSRFFAVTVVGKLGGEVQRLFGVGSVPVNQCARKIFVKTDVPSVARPGEKIKVKVALSDASGKPVAGNVQLWAVDRGVLALTAFSTPDAYMYFFGNYSCPYAFGDSYSDFYPQLSVDKKLIGGGKNASALRKFLDENSSADEQSAVVAAELLRVPASGEAEVELAIPDFDGGMCLMAFALNAEQVGSADAEFAVREQVSAKMTAPRAVAPGDEFEILAEVFNSELPSQNFKWELLSGDEILKSGTAENVKTGGKFVVRERVSCAKEASGKIEFVLNILDVDGKKCLRESVAMVAREPFAAVDSVTVVEVAPQTEAEFANADEFGNIVVGSPVVSIVGALEWLNDYPYGCLEQTAAAAFPQFCVKSLVQAGLLPKISEEGAASRIRSALAHISTMQLANGEYSMWPNYNKAWLDGTLFAYHFLLEADAAGFALPQAQRKKMQTMLADYSVRRALPVAFRAYAAYLSALSGDRRAANFARCLILERSDDFSKFLAGAALVNAGFAAEGMKTISPILEKRFWECDCTDFGCLDSDVRRAGMALKILSEIALESSAAAKLSLELYSMMSPEGHWGSTQKNAWATLGLAAYFRDSGFGVERASIVVNGKSTSLDGATIIPGGNVVLVKNLGERPIHVFVRTREKPESFEPSANGFEISRSYFNANGEPVSSCESGDLLTVKIRVRSDNYCESAVISDLLPGGLEIEDETLVTRSRVQNNSSRQGNAVSSFSETVRERRFDRFLAFGAFRPEGWAEISYRVCATARGKFAVPPVQVESMYDGEARAAWCPENPVFEVK